MPYRVLVDDNSHYMDQSERYELGAFDTWDAAEAASKQIVDQFLASSLRPDMDAKALYEAYVRFGEDPFIVPAQGTHDPRTFSAWTYAKERCALLCRSATSAAGACLPDTRK